VECALLAVDERERHLLFSRPVCAGLFVALALTAGSAPLAWAYKTGNYSWAVAVSRDGRYVIAGSDDMHTYFFDSSSGDGKPLWSHAAQGYVRHVAISGNGTYAASGDMDGSVFFFRSDELGNPLWSYRADSSIYALAMSDHADYLVAGSQRGTAYVFKTDETNPLAQQYAVPGGVLALSLSESKSLVATSGHGDLYFFGEVSSSSGYSWIFRSNTSLPRLAITSDASYIVAGGSNGYLYLFNRSGELVGHERIGGGVSALSIFTTTGRIVAGSTDGSLSMYQIQNGLDLVSSLTTRRPITSTAISESGDLILFANIDGAISMLDQSLAAQQWTFDSGAIVHAVSMSSDGSVMAAVSDTGDVYLFRQEVATQSNETTLMVAFAFTVVATSALAFFLWQRKARLGK
jgi:WD40 repeat protein